MQAGGKLLLVPAILLAACSRPNFRVEGAKAGVPPYAIALLVHLEQPVEEQTELFVLEPEVAITGYRCVGEREVLVRLAEPLEPGRTYTLRAASGGSLPGKRSLSVQPLSLSYNPLPIVVSEGRPALLFTANGPMNASVQEYLL